MHRAMHGGSQVSGKSPRAYLLVPSLHAAVPLKQVDCVAHLVRKDLDLNVARALDEPLQQNALISKGGDGFPFS